MTTGRVLVDSDVWSEFYRKRVGDPSEQVRQLRRLVLAGSDCVEDAADASKALIRHVFGGIFSSIHCCKW